MYCVVFRVIEEGAYKGAITWSSWSDKKAFVEFYDEEQRAVEKIVEEGVSPERVAELCKSSKSVAASMRSKGI